MKLKTVIVCSVEKLHDVLSSGVTPATIEDIFSLGEGKTRVNMHQEEGANPDSYRDWVKKIFSDMEIKSMY